MEGIFLTWTCAQGSATTFDPLPRDGSKHILAGVRKRTGPTEGSVKRLSRRGLQFDSKPWRSAAAPRWTPSILVVRIALGAAAGG